MLSVLIKAKNISIVKFFDPSLQKELIELFSLEEGDLIFMIADTKDKTNQALDHLRRKLARQRQLIASPIGEMAQRPIRGGEAELRSPWSLSIIAKRGSRMIAAG